MTKRLRGPKASNRGRLLRPRSERRVSESSIAPSSVDPEENESLVETAGGEEREALLETRPPRSSETRVISLEETPLSASVSFDEESAQPGGASVALRKLVEEARKTQEQSGNLRTRQEAAYRFISAMAGDWRHFEESTRALFAGDAVRFGELTETWPTDVRDHARQLAFPSDSSRKS